MNHHLLPVTLTLGVLLLFSFGSVYVAICQWVEDTTP